MNLTVFMLPEIMKYIDKLMNFAEFLREKKRYLET